MAGAFWIAYGEKLAVVAVALAALYAIARRLKGVRIFDRSERRLTLLESIALSAHAAVHVVKAGSKYFLIGTGDASKLAELDDAGYTLK